MFKFRNSILGVALLSLFISEVVLAQPPSQKGYLSLGRDATSDEIKAWDIDVRPDFLGLPKGEGSVTQGQTIWEAKCASCHGTFGESNEVFTPIIGGTTKEDIKTGRVASLTDSKQPQRTTIMKVATISSLFDYIQRAMPWNAPRSLTPNDTYSVLAYLLNLAEIVPDDYVLSDQNIAEVQNKMPNRNGMTTNHGLSTTQGKPDVKAVACLSNCGKDEKITSFLPDYARNAHGNLKDQNRIFGPFRGADTSQKTLDALPVGGIQLAQNSIVKNDSPQDLFTKNNCSACHGMTNKIVGPAIKDVATKYSGNKDPFAILKKKIVNGGAGVWGTIPMPAQSQLSDNELKVLIDWVLSNK